MRYLISGASGLIGAALSQRLEANGHEIWRLVRADSATQARVIAWQPEQRSLDASALEGFDAVVHLAGENIKGRWNPAKKLRIRDSRIVSTALLAKTLAALSRPPAVFACASAVGYYGNRGDEVLTEESSAGAGFRAEVCRDWEVVTGPAAAAGIRTLYLRFGLVLAAESGGLKEMLLPFRLGIGGPMGNGKQFWSWISLPDTVGAIHHALAHHELRGPINIVAPTPVRNREFASALGQALHRPALIPAPAFALRILLGEMADEALLSSGRVEPRKLVESGYSFQHPTLSEALGHLL